MEIRKNTTFECMIYYFKYWWIFVHILRTMYALPFYSDPSKRSCLINYIFILVLVFFDHLRNKSCKGKPETGTKTNLKIRIRLLLFRSLQLRHFSFGRTVASLRAATSRKRPQFPQYWNSLCKTSIIGTSPKLKLYRRMRPSLVSNQCKIYILSSPNNLYLGQAIIQDRDKCFGLYWMTLTAT